MRNKIAVLSVLLGTLIALFPGDLHAQGNLTTGRNYGALVQPSGGTANAQTVSPIPPWTSLLKNEICWTPAAANTGATTLAVSGLTATSITYLGGALTSGMLTATGVACVIYDGTSFELQNSQAVSGSGTVGSGTPGHLTCYNATGTTVGNCPNLKDASGGQTVTSVALESKFLISNQGTAQTSGNVAITGWGTGAAVSAVGGYDNTERFTITAGTTPSNNPTIVVTFPDTWPVTPICSIAQIGGTGVIADLTTGTETTTSTGTLTWLATPTNTSTYIFKLSCGI